MAKKQYIRVRIEKIEQYIGLHTAKGEDIVVQALRRFARDVGAPLDEQHVSAHAEAVSIILRADKEKRAR